MRHKKLKVRAQRYLLFGGIYLLSLFILTTLAVISFYSSQNNSAQKIADTASCVLPLQANVLEISYYPRNASDPAQLDPNETGMNVSVSDQEKYVASLVSQYEDFLAEATKYKGYKNPNAPEFLRYSVLDSKVYYEKIPRGNVLNASTGTHRPDYGKILSDNNICDYVDNKGVKEVWMFGYHHGDIEPDESRMSSTFGDISNSVPKEEQTPTQYKLPVCTHPYVLYNFNYSREVETMAHNRIHQLENIIPYSDGTTHYPPTPTNTQGSTFWGSFSEYIQADTTHNYKSACGNAHYAPNWRTSADQYVYDIRDSAQNNCETWDPDPTKSTYVNANCSQWGCTELGFYKWYFQNIPGYQNTITVNGQKMKNWWEALYEPDKFVSGGRTLYGESTYNNCTVPVPTPTPTSVPTLTPTPVPSSTPIPTPTPTLIPSPTFIPLPTAVPTPLPMRLHLSLKYPGIGQGVSENKNPQHPSRGITVNLSTNDGKSVGLFPGAVVFNGNTYDGVIELGNIPQSVYHISAKLENTLPIQSGFANKSSGGQDVIIPPFVLLPGDTNQDGTLDILDFNSIAFNCYEGHASCSNKTLNDLNDDGVINEQDLNIFLRSIASLHR